MTVLTTCSVNSRLSGRGTHSSSSTRMSDQHPLRELEDGYGLLTPDAREMIQEDVDGFSALEIVEEGLDRHPRPDEDRDPSQDLGIRMDDQLWFHKGASLAAKDTPSI